jgi:2-keto-4-pentenoate hydratase/2-oxohepta-3-ene-1,7-dioic acid hydratase in catechol pathway
MNQTAAVKLPKTGNAPMKLLRFEDNGVARLGALRGDTIVALDALNGEYPTMLAIVAGGAEALNKIKELIGSSKSAISLSEARLLCPIERPGKYLAIGMNYRKHLEEAVRLGAPAPTQQLWFNKQTTCLSGPFDAIDPGVSEMVDYEVELGAVIGRAAKGVSEADAKNHVFGYFVVNDVSARDWQRHSPTFTMGKSFDTHGPIGPWIVTADEIQDPHALALRCLVNGETRQQSDTGKMIFNLWQQIAYLSTAFTLEPGDLIATGTPEGVGLGMTPPTFLKAGDVVRCEIDGIGAIENKVAARGI